MAADQDGKWRPPAAVPFDATAKIADALGKKTISDGRGQFVIHAIHLRTGKVLWFSGHAEHLQYPQTSYLFDPKSPNTVTQKKVPAGIDLFCCHYVQLADGNVLVVGGSQVDVHGPTSYDTNTDYRGSSGSSTIALFETNPGKEKWKKLGSLKQPRWYPTAVTLGDGSVLVISGRRESTRGTSVTVTEEIIRHRSIADMVEHLKAPNYGATEITGASKSIPIYPGLHLAPDDRIYTTHTTWGQEIEEPGALALTVTPPASGAPAGATATGTWTEFTLVDHRATQPEREEGMSVMLPVLLDATTKVRRPETVGKFLVIGGGFAVDHDDRSTVQQPELDVAATKWVKRMGLGPTAFHRQKVATPRPAEILDVTPAHGPLWTKAPGTLAKPRINGHCVLLPDATIAIIGGHNSYKWYAKANTTAANSPPAVPPPQAPQTLPLASPGITAPPPATAPPAVPIPVTTPTLEVEIFTPGTGFHTGAAMVHPRMYHSVALLLADGSVIVAGGADPNEHEPPLRYPTGWQGRRYLSTARAIRPAVKTEMLLEFADLDPWPTIPAGTKVVIAPGAATEFTTEFVNQTLMAPPDPTVFIDIKDPLPRDYPAGTLVEFRAAVVGGTVPRLNEWATLGPFNGRITFSTPLNRKDYEIWEPPYFHKPGVRPVLPELAKGKVQVSYGATFTITTPDAARITRVAIMRPACVTHHTDTEQRFIELPMTPVDATSLQATMVPTTDSSLAPPGYYMLWVLAGDLPCVEARFIQLVGAPPLRSPSVPVEAPAPPVPVATPPPAPIADEGDDGGCPLFAAAAAAPVALVALLALRRVDEIRALRAEVTTHPTGARFVRALARPYYRFGRRAVPYIITRPHVAMAICTTVLEPAAHWTRRAARAARDDRGRLRMRRLVPMLSAVGLLTLASAPVAVARAKIGSLAAGGIRRTRYALRRSGRDE